MRDAFAFERAPHVLLSPFVTLFEIVSLRPVARCFAAVPSIGGRDLAHGVVDRPLRRHSFGVLCLAVAAAHGLWCEHGG
jgi:hypothetical protein